MNKASMVFSQTRWVLARLVDWTFVLNYTNLLYFSQTVQSISLLAYLAETHDIWGPFLVVAPASTLHNWQQELTRFVPNLKALPYWGNVKDRATLRKFWSKKEISYNQEAPFHVLITSYQLVREDVSYSFRIHIFILDRWRRINNTFNVSNGNTWYWTKLKTSKIPRA